MDLYEIRGGRLDVITEETEHQEFGTGLTTMEPYKVVSDRRGRATHDAPNLQKFSGDTNESRRFEDSPSSPAEAGDGHGDDDVFKEEETEVGTLTQP